MGWDEGVIRPVALETLGQRYRRYRLADPPAEVNAAAYARVALAPWVALAGVFPLGFLFYRRNF